MKRSEAIELLRKFAVDNELFDLRDQYDVFISKQILDFLESQGMIPPSYFQSPIKDIRYAPESDCHYQDGKYGIDLSEWEPEDE